MSVCVPIDTKCAGCAGGIMPRAASRRIAAGQLHGGLPALKSSTISMNSFTSYDSKNEFSVGAIRTAISIISIKQSISEIEAVWSRIDLKLENIYFIRYVLSC